MLRHDRLRRLVPRALLALGAGLALGLVPALAPAHLERDTRFPSGDGSVPQYRTTGPYLVVCKPDTAQRIQDFPPALKAANEALLAECVYDHIQDAVSDAASGTRILILPGVYEEEPSRARPSPDPSCAQYLEEKNGGTVARYEYHLNCPNDQNLIAITGDGPDEDIACDLKCNLQLEGTGRGAGDVIIDGGFTKLNAIRADRADGVYFRNFTVQNTEFNSLYVIETDGFVIDRVVARNNDEYGFLTFSSDHGLYVDCEAYGNGDSGIYPGSAADTHGARPSIEITRCTSHHNLLGYSGTAGNGVYVHDNDFYANGAGASMDSFFPDHPGLPQDSASFVGNRIYGNNIDYYENYRNGTCALPRNGRPVDENGVRAVCPSVPVPVGTGILVAGGNANLFANNWIYDNWRYGAMQFFVPAVLRNETDPLAQYDTSHFNRYLGNRMGLSPDGDEVPNGLDFWWDEEGAGNCWSGNLGGPDGISSDPAALPDCAGTPLFTPGNPLKQALLAPCATWSRENLDPPGCDWFRAPARPS